MDLQELGDFHGHARDKRVIAVNLQTIRVELIKAAKIGTSLKRFIQ